MLASNLFVAISVRISDLRGLGMSMRPDLRNLDTTDHEGILASETKERRRTQSQWARRLHKEDM